jgi:hypothetical protein
MCDTPQQNPLEQSIYTLKNEGWEGKTGPVLGWITVARRGIKGESEGGQISMCFMCMKMESKTC